MVETWGYKEQEKIRDELEEKKKLEKSIFKDVPNSIKIVVILIVLLLAWNYFFSEPTCPSGTYTIKQNCHECPYLDMELSPDGNSCRGNLEENGTCRTKTYFNNETSMCESDPIITQAKKPFDSKTILIIGAIVIGVVFFMQKANLKSRELTHAELLAKLEEHIYRMQHTPFGTSGFQLNPKWNVSICPEVDIPEYTNYTNLGEGHFRRNLKYFVIRAQDTYTMLSTKYLVALDIFYGDLKSMKVVGEASDLLDISDVVIQPSPQDKADAYREKWRKSEGLEVKK